MPYVPETEMIFKKKAKLFRESNPPVYLLPDGRFAAQHNGQWVAKDSIKALDKVTSATAVVVRAVDLANPFTTPIDIVAYPEKGPITKAGVKYGRWNTWYVFDETLVAKAKDLAERREKAEEAFGAEKEKILEAAIAIDENNFGEISKTYGKAST